VEVGFIGLGNMGKAMAGNLLKAGHRVRVWNRSRGPVDDLVAQGAEPADSPAHAFRGDAVISMLADDAAVRAVMLDGQLLAKAPKSTIHVNMATISVALAKELADIHASHGIRYVAAPVFGRPGVAAAGKLNILAAGEAAAIDRVQPLFDAMGQRTWRLGDEPHRANVVKVAGNFMIACAIETMAEAAALARANGVSAAEFLEVMTGTLFAAPIYKGYSALIVDERFEPAGFRTKLGLKDVRLALAAGEGANVPLPFASVVRDNLIDAIAQGDGDKDWVVLADVALRRAGLSS